VENSTTNNTGKLLLASDFKEGKPVKSRFAKEVRKRKEFFSKLAQQIERQIRELRITGGAKQDVIASRRVEAANADGAREALEGIQTLLIEAGIYE
jgi:hypothetical protein